MRIIKIAILALITFLFLKFPLVAQTRGTSISSSNFNSGSFASVILPSAGSWNVAAGGTIVGCVQAATPGTVTITDTGSANTFSVINTVTRGGNVLTMFKAENTTAVASDVLTVHFSSGSASFTGETATQYSGTATSAYDTGATASQAGSPNITSGSFTPSQALEMVVACGTFGGGGVTAGNITTLPSPTPMSLSVTDPTNVVQMEDGNLFGVPSSLTASMLTGSNGLSALIVATIKSSNTGTPPTLTETFSGQDAIIPLISGSVITPTPYIYSGHTATVTFTVGNPNLSTTLNGIAFTDTLPTNLVVATPNGLGGTCTGSSATAASSTIALSGLSLTAGTSCTVIASVTSTGAGSGVNPVQVTSTTTGAGIGPTATATLTMYGAATSSIGSVTQQALDHTSVNFYWTPSNVNDSCKLYYGLSSGNYIYSNGSAPDCALTISGLAPNTDYYIMPTERPNANNYTGWCGIGGSCGSSEIHIKTLALPNPHPALPTPPATWTPAEPNVSGYTLVSMKAATSGGTDTGGKTYLTGDCVAASSVANPGGSFPWSSGVTANDTYQTVLNEINLDTLIEHAKGSTCVAQQLSGSFNTSIAMPVYTPGGSNDWVVIRTHQASSPDQDFPPFGVRTGPQYAAHLATIMTAGSNEVRRNFVTVPNTILQNFTGQIFDCFQVHCNHFWIENLEFNHPYNGTLYPTGIVDPPAIANYTRWASDTTVTTLPSGTTPDHMVLDRIYAPGQPYPANELGCFGPGGTNWAVLSSYCVTNFRTVGVIPPDTNPPNNIPPVSSSGTTITVLPSTFQLNALAGSPMGTTATATITCSGANISTYTGAFQAWLGSSGLTFEYQTATGVSCTCSTGPCATTSVATPTLADVPVLDMMFFGGNFASGSVTFSYYIFGLTLFNGSPTVYTQFRPLGAYWYPTQYGIWDNNYMQAIGQTVYNDAGGPFEDLTWTHNYFHFPRENMQANPAWDGYGYSYRNVLESKQQQRALFSGNFFDGGGSFRNPGNVFYVAGSWNPNNNGFGTQDINFSNNVSRHISTGIQIAGGGTSPGPPDAPQASRLQFTNNFWLDLDRDIYQTTGSPGFASGFFSTYPMGSDITVTQNTVGLTLGNLPALIEVGGASLPQSTVMGEGLNYSNNLMLSSLAPIGDPILSIDCCQPTTYSNFPTNPTVPQGFAGPQPAGTWQGYLDGNFIHTNGAYSSPTVPNWNMGHNVVVGAQTSRGGPYTDLNSSQITSFIQSLWPSPDTTTLFPCYSGDPFLSRCPSSGATLLNRTAAIGWTNTDLSKGNPNLYPVVPSVWNATNIGANVTVVNQATGTVQGIVVSPGQTAIGFAYTAPDARACSVDISPTGAGTWTRLTDAGGAFARTLTFTSLTASTAYDYRLQCYFDQSSAMEFLPGQITSGTVSTAATGTVGVFQTFTLPATATKAVFAFVPVGGTTVNQTCTSTCSVTLPHGVSVKTTTFENVSSVQVGAVGTTSVMIN